MSKIKNGGLDQYDAEPSEQQQFEPAGIDRVKICISTVCYTQTFVDFPFFQFLVLKGYWF